MSFHNENSKDELISALDDVDTRICEINCDLLEEEIIANCDTLESKVKSAFEKNIIHLTNIKEDHLATINKYRMQQLQLAASKKEKLTAITRPIASRCHELIQRLNNKPSDKEDRKEHVFQEIQREIDEFHRLLDSSEKNIAKANFGDRIMSLTDNNRFFKLLNHLGCLYYSTSKQEIEDPIATLQGHVRSVRDLKFLSNGELASCSSDNSIKIWNPQKGVLLNTLSYNRMVLALAELPNHLLASGCELGVICIWNLNLRKLEKTLTGHNAPVVSLSTLPNGNLASFSYDNTIKIWDTLLEEEDCLIQTIIDHDLGRCTPQLGSLSNGSLVTCSTGCKWDLQNSIIKTWDPVTGKLSGTFSTLTQEAVCLFVLKNDNVAVGFDSGDVRIFDLFAKIVKNRFLCFEYTNPVLSLFQVSNGSLITVGYSQFPLIQIWDINDESLLAEKYTDHTSDIICITSTKGQSILATGSDDNSIKIWKI